MAQYFDEAPDTYPEEPESGRPGPITVLILLLLIIAMLTTLLWPLVSQYRARRVLPPTPTPIYLQEA